MRSWLADNAPEVPAFEAVRCDVPLSILLGRTTTDSARPPPSRSEASDPDHDLQHRTWTITRTEPISRVALERWATRSGSHIFRAKGFVQLADAPSLPVFCISRSEDGGLWKRPAPGEGATPQRRSCVSAPELASRRSGPFDRGAARRGTAAVAHSGRLESMDIVL